MSLEQGMDVARVRDIAKQLLASGDKIATVGQSGRTQLSVLADAWEGADVEQFQGSWQTAEQSLSDASTRIRTYSQQLVEQADQQDEASNGGGGAGGGAGGSGGKDGSSEPKSLIDTIKDFWNGDVKKAYDKLKKGWGAVTGLAGLQRYLAGKGTYLQDLKFLGKYLGKSEAVKALGRIGPMTLKEAKAAGLAGWTHKLGKFGGLIRGAGGLLGKVAGPVGMVFGGIDLYNGIKDGDWLTAVKGGAGLVSGAAVTALAIGGAALAGTAAAPFILGAAVIGGAVWAGIEIWQNREAIWNGMKTAGKWIGDTAGDLAEGAKNVAGDVKDKAGSVIKGIGKGIGSVFG